MNALHEAFARAAAWWWAALADHLWQATLFAALVFAATLLLRRAPARLRHTLWLVASAKFILPSALFAYAAALAGVEASWLRGGGAGTKEAAVPVIYQIAGPVSSINEAREVGLSAATAPHAGEFYCLLTLAWLLGSAGLLFVWLKRRREFLRAAGAGREAYAGREYEALESARRRLGLRTDVRLLLSPSGVEPGVWRTRRPIVLVPEAIAEHLDAEELEALMLHELVHIERRDNAVGNFQMALSCLFWFHPLVWFIGRRLLAERERACDERVLEVGGGRSSYASSILKVVRFCFGWKVAGVSGAAAGSNLRRRIEMIMHEQRSGKARAWQRVLPAAAGVLALAFSAGAGLISHAQGDAARAQAGGEQASQGPAAGGGGSFGRRARVRRTQAEGDSPATEEIRNAPEAVVYFENLPAAPLVINDAKLKMVTREQLRRADGEGADFYDEEKGSEFFLTLPTVTVTNVSGKTVREVGVGFVRDGRVNVIMGYASALKPGEAQTFDSVWGRRNAILPGTFSDVSVRLAWVRFEDGSEWGVPSRVPPPPKPPQPPQPPPPGDSSMRRMSPTAAAGIGQTGTGTATAMGGGGGGGGSRLGKLRLAPEPVYPAMARSVGVRGEVVVRVTVDEYGKVVAAKAVSGHPLLRSAAEEAARGAQFEPKLMDGTPVKVAGTISYHFTLSGSEDEPEQ